VSIEVRASSEGLRKAAMVCIALGPDVAAEIFKQLPAALAEQLTIEMARTPHVDPEEASNALEELLALVQARSYIAQGGIDYAREVLERAVGSQRAVEILARLSSAIEERPFEFLRAIPVEQIHAFLQHESPQTIAFVLANMPTRQLAAQVLERMEPEMQADIARRIARLEHASPEIARDVASLIEQSVVGMSPEGYVAAGGSRALAEILNSSSRQTERNILSRLGNEDAELADEVRALLFMFEDILLLDDRAIQLVLREVDTHDLALALRGASEQLKARIMSNMSQRAATMLREEIEYTPPQRRRIVEEAQEKIVAVVRRLEEAGTIVVARNAAEEDEVL
jgi:flagellar motor switch protein FliG